jgi:hypothetical protein
LKEIGRTGGVAMVEERKRRVEEVRRRMERVETILWQGRAGAGAGFFVLVLKARSLFLIDG